MCAKTEKSARFSLKGVRGIVISQIYVGSYGLGKMRIRVKRFTNVCVGSQSYRSSTAVECHE